MNDRDTILKMKRSIVNAATYAGEGHIASAFSIIDILWVLYDKIIDNNEIKKLLPERDYFVLSKGHGSLAIYAILVEKGLLEIDSLDDFCQFNSILGGHPDCNKIKYIEASTGSLGHGLPFAVGIALSNKIQKMNNNVYTIIGDGEANEGSVWEAFLLAAQYKLNNLYCIVDFNHSTDRALDLGNLSDKLKAFGWETLEIDGHNQEEILSALKRRNQTKPNAIIAQTIKGKGCKRMEQSPMWHHKVPTEKELIEILKELEQNA